MQGSKPPPPSCVAISRQERPYAGSLAILKASITFFGRPELLSLRTTLTRSTMRLRSKFGYGAQDGGPISLLVLTTGTPVVSGPSDR